MANSNWADKNLSAPQPASSVPVAHERRSADRRVSHVDNGFVWGPAEQLLKLVCLADELSQYSRSRFEQGYIHQGVFLGRCAEVINEVLGLGIDIDETRTDKDRHDV